MSGERPCPLCGEPLYGWLVLPPRAGEATVGMPLEAEDELVIQRCENCGVALERRAEIDPASEWAALGGPTADESGTVSAPNRASLQAAIGLEGWAGIDRAPGLLIHTPRSLELLADLNGHRLEGIRTPFTRRALGWMWQTLLNGLTFHPNFAREVGAGRIRFADAPRGRFAFLADAVVTVLGAIFVAIVALPLELAAVALRRGGELEAEAVPAARRPAANGARL